MTDAATGYHEFVDGVCRYCGAAEAAVVEKTCTGPRIETNPRAIPATGVGDYDFIGKRLKELEQEKLEALNRPAEE